MIRGRGYLILLVCSLCLAAFYWKSLDLKQATLSNGAAFTPSECWFQHAGAIRIECGYMSTRSASADMPTFKLPVVVLRHSWWKNSNSPMLHLSGGPGGSAYLDSDSMSFHIQNFIAQDWKVDFVLYDQRGTGLSQPTLRCENANSDRLKTLALVQSVREEYLSFIESMQGCLTELTEDATYASHLNYISTDHSIDDISDLHSLLNVKQWILMGVSYGTRLALESARKIPHKIKSMILDSVYPPEVDGFKTLAENDYNALENILTFCQSDLSCDNNFPNLEQDLVLAFKRIAKQPIQLLVKHRQSNAQVIGRQLILTPGRLIRLLSYTSYDSSLLADIPAAIKAIAIGDQTHESLERLAENLLEIELFDNFSEPVYMVTECFENGGFESDELSTILQKYRSKYSMLELSLDALHDSSMCDGWRQLSRSEVRNFREVVNTDIPSLVLSGGLDSVTPASWARGILVGLTNHVYLEYPHLGHAILHSSICANDEVQHFLNPALEKAAFCSEKERLQDRVESSLEWSF